MKKFVISMIVAILMLVPIQAFADTSSAVDNGIKLDSTSNVNGVQGQFIGKSKQTISENYISPQRSIFEGYSGWMTISAKAVSSTHLEANWTFSCNDYVYYAKLKCNLQKYDQSDHRWYTVDNYSRNLNFNPSTKKPRGQFNFYHLSKGAYRVEIYGVLDSRNTQFEELSTPESNTVYMGDMIG
ncbi:MAG: hypothetical protein K0Q53_1998 [Massilibacillus sp.]|jgi:hypothetical protein|nr:hypothetical protein [Massilibacillus sp.]